MLSLSLTHTQHTYTAHKHTTHITHNSPTVCTQYADLMPHNPDTTYIANTHHITHRTHLIPYHTTHLSQHHTPNSQATHTHNPPLPHTHACKRHTHKHRNRCCHRLQGLMASDVFHVVPVYSFLFILLHKKKLLSCHSRLPVQVQGAGHWSSHPPLTPAQVLWTQAPGWAGF
jgi:hypothetical protein